MFSPDLPITTRADDLLGRAPFSRAFGKALLEYAHKESIVTALYGGWGSGKSSIINMARERIREQSNALEDDQKPVVLEFNPWNHSDQSHLILQFFKVLSGALNRQTTVAKLTRLAKSLKLTHIFSLLWQIYIPDGRFILLRRQQLGFLRGPGYKPGGREFETLRARH